MKAKEHEHVIEKVGDFVDYLGSVVLHRGDEDLCGLFADFLENLLLPSGEETTGVGAFLWVALSVRDYVINLL